MGCGPTHTKVVLRHRLVAAAGVGGRLLWGDLLSLILSLRGWVSGWLWLASEGWDPAHDPRPLPQLPLLSAVWPLTEKSREDAGAIMSSAVGAT